MNFVRQGAWMVVCTTVAGVFMFGVHGLGLFFLSAASYGLFMVLLNLVNFSTILSPGIQTVFAYETAGAKDGDKEKTLSANVVGVLVVLTGLWGLGAGIVFFGETWILAKLKMTNSTALWVTLLVILPHLWLPVLMGVLQGRQLFGWLGWAVLCNGFGRFLTIFCLFAFLGANINWIMFGPMIGVSGALVVSAFLCRDLLRMGSERMAWRRWLWRAVPFALGPGVFQFMLTADAIVARASFDEVQSGHYAAATLVGRGLVMFVGPLAGVMFPRLVKETSGHTGSKLVRDTALATLAVVVVVSVGSWIGYFALPYLLEYSASVVWIPDSIHGALASKRTELLWVSGVVPLFLGAMGPLAVANVFISHLVALKEFRKISCLILVILVYGIGLAMISFSVNSLIFWVGLGNLGLLLGALGFSYRVQRGVKNS